MIMVITSAMADCIVLLAWLSLKGKGVTGMIRIAMGQFTTNVAVNDTVGGPRQSNCVMQLFPPPCVVGLV
jgi:hypothetical protein